MRDCRFNTVHLSKFDSFLQAGKAGISSLHGVKKKASSKMEANFCIERTRQRSINIGYVDHREQGRMNTVPITQKYEQKGCAYILNRNIRMELQKLNYRWKLNRIQQIFKNVRQLCRRFGYFIVTLAMFQFSYGHEGITMSVWIHPDRRSCIPLHPIRKLNEFECELVCAGELRETIQNIFPTVHLGDGKTFANIIAYIGSLKCDMQRLLRKTNRKQIERKDSTLTNELSFMDRTNDSKNSFNVVSMKTMSIHENERILQIIQQENNRNRYRIGNKNKQTRSTLVDSLKSSNSIRDRMKIQEGAIGIREQRKQQFKLQRKFSLMTQCNFQRKVSQGKFERLERKNSNNDEIGKKRGEEIYANVKESHLNNGQNMKVSQVKKSMSMSMQIQSEMSNLFGVNDDTGLVNNEKNNDIKLFTNSILQKVAEQLEDLF